MSPDTILALPADQLPRALYAAGLAPQEARAIQHEEEEPYPIWCDERRPGGGTVLVPWQPHIRWDHAAPLLERFRVSIQQRQGPGGRPLPTLVGVSRQRQLEAPTCAEIPATICRVALLIQADAPSSAAPTS